MQAPERDGSRTFWSNLLRKGQKIPVVLLMTSNCSEEMYGAAGYDALLKQYKGTLEAFIGPARIFVCGDTLQVRDYSKYNWTMFDPEKKQKRHEDTFAEYLHKAYALGKSI